MSPAYPTPRAAIARLPEILVNQIAAGEVVERPANVVKELVENSLDAGSTRIDIQLEEGGMTSIAIIDNGMGIEPEELSLALERHTTSKIRALEDLESISSFGFRGEALSSIASVSETEIRSRTAAHPKGTFIRAEFGRIVEGPLSIASAEGTTIQVRGLFSQLPARAKFLRSSATEFSHCSRMIKELALGNAPVVFSLSHQGKQVSLFATPSRASRVQEVLRVDWEPFQIQDSREDMILEAFLSPPEVIQDRSDLYLFINGRAVRNQSLKSAVRAAYQEALGEHHEPSGAVFLDVRKDWVDVNVHPQKLEVRCLKQEQIYQWLLVTLRKRLTQFSIPERCVPAPAEVREYPRSWQPRPFTSSLPVSAMPPRPAPIEIAQTAMPTVRYLGQLHDTYLLCEDRQGLLLLDPHGLDELRALSRLQKFLAAGKIPSVLLLIPKIFRLSEQLGTQLEAKLADFIRAGFEIEPFGDGDIAVKSVPQGLAEVKAETVIRESLEKAESADDVIRITACHSAFASQQRLTSTEISALLSTIGTVDRQAKNSHGTPVFLEVPLHQLRKQFEK